MEHHQHDEEVRTHLLTMLSVASGMAGLCATAIGLIGIIKRLTPTEIVVDDLFAMGALLYLFVTGMSFACLRTRWGKRSKGAVLAIDIAFFLGLATVVIASVLLTWMVI
jgi:hypothetical protein